MEIGQTLRFNRQFRMEILALDYERVSVKFDSPSITKEMYKLIVEDKPLTVKQVILNQPGDEDGLSGIYRVMAGHESGANWAWKEEWLERKNSIEAEEL